MLFQPTVDQHSIITSLKIVSIQETETSDNNNILFNNLHSETCNIKVVSRSLIPIIVKIQTWPHQTVAACSL